MDTEFLNVVWVTASVVAATGTGIMLLVLLCKTSQRCRARYRHREKLKQQKQQQIMLQPEENPPTERQNQQKQQKQQPQRQQPLTQPVDVRDEDEETDGRRSVTCCNCFTISAGYIDEPTGGSRTSVYTFDDFLQRSFSHSQQETTQSGSTASAAQAVTSASAAASASATVGREGENRKSSVKLTQSLGRSSAKGSRKRSGLARRRSLQAQESAARAAKASKEPAPIKEGSSVAKVSVDGQQLVTGADPLRSLAIDLSDSDCDDCDRDNSRSAVGRATVNADFLSVTDRRQPSGLLEKYEMEWPPRPSNRQSPRSSQMQLDNLNNVQTRATPGRRGHIIFGRGNSSLYSAGQL